MLKKYYFSFGLFLLVSLLIFFNFSESKSVSVNSFKYQQPNLKVVDGKYVLIDHFIKSIDIETSKDKFLSSFQVEDGNSQLICENGTDYIGTNCSLDILEGDDVTETYSLVVHGDVTGDGKVTITDMYKMFVHSKNISFLEGAYKEAADIDGDNQISFQDSKSLAYYGVGKQKIPVPSNVKRENVIKITDKNISILKNSSKKINAFLAYSDVTILKWESSDETIAKVDNTGVVLGLDKGSAIITVTASNGDTASVSVYVDVVVPVTGIVLNSTFFNLKVGNSVQLTAAVSPIDATNSAVTWSSNNTNVATVDSNGVVRAVGGGTTTIMVTSVDGGYSASCQVEVNVPVTGVRLNKSSFVLNVGETETLIVTVLPTNATNKEVTWSSSNTDVATVDNNGVVKAVGSGTTTIMVTSVDGGYSASCQVSVNVSATGIQLNKTNLVLNNGEMETLIATVLPTNATNKEVTWSSSNTDVATVDNNGVVRSVGAGIADIIVSTADGSYQNSCSVSVKDSYITPTSNKLAYKTNFSSTRTGAVMQSWAVYGNYLYVAQRNGSIDSSKHYPAGFITRISKSAITNSTHTVFTNTKYNGYVHLERFGHMTSLTFEETGGITYLWTGCNDVESDDESSADAATNLCRIPLSDISFTAKRYESTYGTVYNGRAVSIDSDRRILVLRTGTRATSTYTVYNLDDYVKNGKVGGAGAKILYSFKVSNGSTLMSDGVARTDISWQGFAVYNNYIYIYEGNPKDSTSSGVYISVWSIRGENKIYRQSIGYPGTDNWEPEGIQVYGDLDGASGAYIYIGYTNKDSGSPLIHYIYRLAKS